MEKHKIKDATYCKHAVAESPLCLASEEVGIVSEAHLFPQQNENSYTPISMERAFELMSVLEEGWPAVHSDHGIGIFEGLQRRTLDTTEKEYLVLRYAEGDSLSVPVEFAYKVTAYVGRDQPSIYRLGGTLWFKTKKRAKEDAATFAKELLFVAGQRETTTRPPYTIAPDIEKKLEDSFPYEMTLDQRRTWQEIQDDLRRSHPMNRLVVGDVGFGKTEVALRSAYHVAKNGRQVAVLAPTTLLVQQHFDTFTQRLPKDVPIILLSRFVSNVEQNRVRQMIADGEAMIAIGTHALLSSGTRWHNLGLVILDEEQRFGVKQKEHFKKIRASADVMSLSATPIPRTLSMALSGLRSLSLIATPPEGRKSVKTFVRPATPTLLTEILQRELGRGGQVYVVAPKIRHLSAIAEQVRAAHPRARVAIAHGQLPDTSLSNIVHDFDTGAIDILISSSIVENGLDLPNANTMIVWHATHFGLAQLYQLRGRVGRRDRQGYAY
ncbi:MAG: DEAD/DEAH box helicase, partial [Acidobacteriota bacterium]